MGLLVCFCCGKQRIITPIKRGAKFKCGNCGAARVRVIRSRAHANYIAWCDREGCNAEKARHETYAALRGYAERRGYKNGWIANKFKKIFGSWPNGESVEPGTPAGSGILHWIRKENSNYAKQRKAEEAGGLANVVDGLYKRRVDNVDATSSLMTDDDWGVKL